MKNIKQLRAVMGDLLSDDFYDDLELDQAERATMSMLIPPQMVNTMVPDSHDAGTPSPQTFTEAFYADPIRRYMLPVFSDRRTDWPSHPYSSRDSLHEHDMWKAEGLTHRYPTKVLAEVLSTCPQYCGHCTRMDLVGNSTPTVKKLKLELKPVDRMQQHLDYLRATPSVRDVVVSGGDVGNMPWKNLEAYVDQILDVENIRDIRLATKALMGLPQHWFSDEVLAGAERLATKASSRGVGLAVHTHVNHANSVTPLVARASRGLLDVGIRDVRNQGVLMAGINNSVEQMLDLCFALLDGASILPYYFYMPDMIPFAEHWRVSLADAQRLQHGVMGYLPGFATPASHLRRAVRRQALGAPGRRVRPRARASRTGRRTTAPASSSTTRTPCARSTSTTTRCTAFRRRARSGGSTRATRRARSRLSHTQLPLPHAEQQPPQTLAPTH